MRVVSGMTTQRRTGADRQCRRADLHAAGRSVRQIPVRGFHKNTGVPQNDELCGTPVWSCSDDLAHSAETGTIYRMVPESAENTELQSSAPGPPFSAALIFGAGTRGPRRTLQRVRYGTGCRNYGAARLTCTRFVCCALPRAYGVGVREVSTFMEPPRSTPSSSG